MAGGLLQIVSAGKEDIFLTINPQITFFKIVYLRYSNFAIETHEETFDGSPNFGEEVTCNLSKIGDLIHQIYVKIDLPEVLIQKINYTSNPSIVSSLQLNKLNIYIKPLFVLWRKLYAQAISTSSNFATITQELDTFINSDQFKIYNVYDNIFRTVANTISDYYYLDLIHWYHFYFDGFANSIYDQNATLEYRSSLLKFLIDFKQSVSDYKRQLINEVEYQENINKLNETIYYRFAWIKKLGLRLIERISLELGGQVVDSFSSDMLNVWYELCLNINHKDTYYKMIGNVNSLTNYNSDKKPAYSMYIPIPFWFCRFHGVALPCIALRYHDIQISVKFRDLNDCIFFEPIEDARSDDINLGDYVRFTNASLLIDYVYLGQDEREKFGNSRLEYLIEQHKYIQYTDIQIPKFNCDLYFYNSVKELFWTVQSKSAIQIFKQWDVYNDVNMSKITNVSNIGDNLLSIQVSIYGLKIGDKIRITKTKFYNGDYIIDSITEDNQQTTSIVIKGKYVSSIDNGYLQVINTSQLVDNMTLVLNGINVRNKIDPTYFNTLQSYIYHSNSIDDGIYMYSFARKPEILQPSGSTNLSVISSKSVFFDINPSYFNRLKNNNDTLIVKMMSKSYNILSIKNGMASLEFSI